MACAAVGAEGATVEPCFGCLSKEMNIILYNSYYHNTIIHERGELEIQLLPLIKLWNWGRLPNLYHNMLYIIISLVSCTCTLKVYIVLNKNILIICHYLFCIVISNIKY